jgi:hypothetical protein
LYYSRYNQLDLNFKKSFPRRPQDIQRPGGPDQPAERSTIFARQKKVGNSLGDATMTPQGGPSAWRFR